MPKQSLYLCKYPGCKFQTTSRDRIDYHHIIPRSMPGTTNKPFNRLWLCPDHHRAIYVPGMKAGHHSIVNADSIIVLYKRTSTAGDVLEYTRCSDSKSFYYFYKTGETWDK